VLTKKIEIIVGLFIIAGVFGLIMLAFRVSGLTRLPMHQYYTLKAEFDNVGDLKVRAPVTIAGVVVGQIQTIKLDHNNFRALVQLAVDKKDNNLPVDTSARILTQGLLGSNYISLTPGFSNESLKPGAMIQTTHSALILENLIGQFMYSMKNNGKEKKE